MTIRGGVPDTKTLRRIVAESHERSRRYGIDPDRRARGQAVLSPSGLVGRQRDNGEWIDLLRPQFDALHDLLGAQDFTIFAIDDEGYILLMKGGEEFRNENTRRNCVPGFRWTERDVGTSAISLCLKHQVPIQLTDADHYCRQAHGYTSSAAPVFGRGGELVGVVMITGRTELVHPHTLYMTTTIAGAVERELRILRRNRELDLHAGFLSRIIESSHSGIMILDRENIIWRINRRGSEIFGKDGLEGQSVTALVGLRIDIAEVEKSPTDWVNRECVVRLGKRSVRVIHTVRPVRSLDGEILGTVVEFEAMKAVSRLANTIAGTRAHYTFSSLIGSSAKFVGARDLAVRAAQSSATVLLQGETGTGKELFAQAVHNGGARREHPFVPINCGAIPAELLESELFGYSEGSFTGGLRGGRPGKFELADGGTILLDEIGDMPHPMQVKLLRVLQTGEVYRIGAHRPVRVDTRIIACTHVDLTEAVARKRFREDLYYRLNVLPVSIPSLRERGEEDILELAEFFLGCGNGRPSLSESARETLVGHSWPGNVRELENCIRRALHVCEGEFIEPGHLDLPVKPAPKAGWSPLSLEGIERAGILSTLENTGYNMAEAARILRVSRTTLYRRVKTYMAEGLIPPGAGPRIMR